MDWKRRDPPRLAATGGARAAPARPRRQAGFSVGHGALRHGVYACSALLAVCGLAAYHLSDRASWTALLPCLAGGLFATTTALSAARRVGRRAATAACGIALAGVGLSLRGAIAFLTAVATGDLRISLIVLAQTATAGLCLAVFLGSYRLRDLPGAAGGALVENAATFVGGRKRTRA